MGIRGTGRKYNVIGDGMPQKGDEHLQSIGFDAAISVLPAPLKSRMAAVSLQRRRSAEEIRLRAGRPPGLVCAGRELPADQGEPVTVGQLRDVLEIATGGSLYSAEQALSQGYITAAGGCRIGVCGTAVVDAGGFTGIRDISSVCVRIAGKFPGDCEEIFRLLKAENFPSLVIISPPGYGKTTFLRELIRRVSDAGVRISLADERGEVAAASGGISAFDVGRCTDVMTGAPKAEAIMRMLKSMSPEIIAMDEITDERDAHACMQAAHCGVRVMATVHGDGVRLLSERSLYRTLGQERVFKMAAVISIRDGKRVYEVEKL